ncbi:ABC-F family ATP-binding cassette domain-containing protein [Streptomyces iconiensis]|uniref:ABC-F family ATP-binding cassette domain-containing protein n=1 Tax=Streptomyces iconiensis TaxID=1384038 RepID=A0ABT7A515_9ACTN|nr:ABC-F family ATP-binding cassette domain-containing protein [Streptomyces iconiensis]MDJ1135896.1 ABC-F family ATP-binding cassette domain-containing protein [Streptomyces iconiensis]
MPTQITAHAVTRSYEGRTVLDGVTCTLSAGERTGIVGENGSGKTTLLKLLAGRELPDEGEVVLRAEGGVGYLAQEERLAAELTVQQVIEGALGQLRSMERRLHALEASMSQGDASAMGEYGELLTLFEARGGYEAEARVERALHGLGLVRLPRDRAVGGLSGGERVRLRLAALLAANPEVLLLDEPTNHLDDAALTWLEDHLRTRPGTTVAVSHDRTFLERVASTLLEVDADRKQVVRYGNGYAGYLQGKAAARRRWAEEHDRWRSDIARLQEAAATTARRVAPGRAMKDGNKMAYDRAAGRVQQSLASRVRSAEERLRRLLADPVPPPPEPLRFARALRPKSADAPRADGHPGTADGHPGTADGQLGTADGHLGTGGTGGIGAPGGVSDPEGEPRGECGEVRAGAVVIAAEGVSVAGRLRRTDLALAAGERLLVTGANGAGKSTLLQVLAGELDSGTGRVIRRGRIGHLGQDPQLAHARPGMTLLEAYAYGRAGAWEEHAERLLSLGLFTRERFAVRVGHLSTGQRQRLALARLLTEPADALLLDEPTNHLSPALVEELEQALEGYEGALVVVSHDRLLRHRWRGTRMELTPRGRGEA